MIISNFKDKSTKEIFEELHASFVVYSPRKNFIPDEIKKTQKEIIEK